MIDIFVLFLINSKKFVFQFISISFGEFVAVLVLVLAVSLTLESSTFSSFHSFRITGNSSKPPIVDYIPKYKNKSFLTYGTIIIFNAKYTVAYPNKIDVIVEVAAWYSIF